MWSVIGQDRAVATLRAAVEGGRLAHAYLFVGPRAVGKATAARQFAQALNCRGEDPPCGRCRSCHLIAEDKHPDVEFVGVGGLCEEPSHRDHGADGSREVRICQVRRIERIASRSPFEGRYRVVVVDPADALNVEAANAFLKTLEEPPQGVVLILISEREEALLPTVRSRCRRVVFGPMSRRAVRDALVERWQVSNADAERLAERAGGRIGRAIAALRDESAGESWRLAAEEAAELAAAPYAVRFARVADIARRYSRDQDAVDARLEGWTEWWRGVLAAAADPGGRSRLDGDAPALSRYNVEDVVHALAAIDRAGAALRSSGNPALVLEALMLELPAPASRN